MSSERHKTKLYCRDGEDPSFSFFLIHVVFTSLCWVNSFPTQLSFLSFAQLLWLSWASLLTLLLVSPELSDSGRLSNASGLATRLAIFFLADRQTCPTHNTTQDQSHCPSDKPHDWHESFSIRSCLVSFSLCWRWMNVLHTGKALWWDSTSGGSRMRKAKVSCMMVLSLVSIVSVSVLCVLPVLVFLFV